MIITIDGPVASGKSTVARLLAQKLGFYYLYTGFLYRGLAYVLEHHYHYTETMMAHPRQEDIDAIMHIDNGIRIFEYRYEQGKAKVLFKGEDISQFLKTKNVDEWSSMLSSHAIVRHAIFEYQLCIGHEHDVVAEGRDMGTVVFPHAQHKFFLTASEDVRAHRWQEMQQKQGAHYTFEESLQAIRERDARDTQRAISPLMKAPDAMLIDASHKTVTEVVDYMASVITKDLT